jgi:hypothetical protein
MTPVTRIEIISLPAEQIPAMSPCRPNEQIRAACGQARGLQRDGVCAACAACAA